MGQGGGIKRGIKRGRAEGNYKRYKTRETGRVKGRIKAILLDIEAKFGPSKAKRIKNLLAKINDMNSLEKIKKEVIKAETWDDFVRVFRNHK